MAKRLDLDFLRKENVGKIFGWLTVLDVFRDEKNKIKFKCQCKCGKECIKDFGKVISNHTKSCGCFKFTKDYSCKLKSIWATKHEVIRDRADRYSQWCKDNPDKIRLSVERQRNTYLKNPDIMKRKIASRKKTLEENPDIQQRINEKLIKFYENNPDKRTRLSEIMKHHYEDESNRKKISDGLKRFYSDESNRLNNSIRAKRWAEENRDKIEEYSKQHSEYLKKRRLYFIHKAQNDISSDFEEFTKIIHPSQLNDLLSGNIKSADMIMTKCPICDNYEEHAFNNTWKLIKMKFRTGRPPLCTSCRNHISSSSYEDEISNIIKSFYDGECLRNSRDIISPFELDLYYPEKRIAVEYNGSYWHNESCKPADYHYNKFIACCEYDITLVSIFDNDWVYNKDEVVAYLKSLFNNEEHNLSYVYNNKEIVNLNYPIPHLNLLDFSEIKENYYLNRGKKVFTCGYAVKNCIME